MLLYVFLARLLSCSLCIALSSFKLATKTLRLASLEGFRYLLFKNMATCISQFTDSDWSSAKSDQSDRDCLPGNLAPAESCLATWDPAAGPDHGWLAAPWLCPRDFHPDVSPLVPLFSALWQWIGSQSRRGVHLGSWRCSCGQPASCPSMGSVSDMEWRGWRG